MVFRLHFMPVLDQHYCQSITLLPTILRSPHLFLPFLFPSKFCIGLIHLFLVIYDDTDQVAYYMLSIGSEDASTCASPPLSASWSQAHNQDSFLKSKDRKASQLRRAACFRT
jgi:hypothetical protein